MIFDEKTATQQVQQLLQVYNRLHLLSKNDRKIELSGAIVIYRNSMNFTLYKEYKIKIVIPIGTNELPYIYETDQYIVKNYSHIYPDSRLCLETDSYIRIHFIEGFSLLSWMSEFVEPYFFSYEYYKRYGEFPFGERLHNIEGLIQTYQELFNEKDIQKTLKLMEAISTTQYRGHLRCPCGSNKKIRSCHGPVIRKYYLNVNLKEIVLGDYEFILEVLKRRYDQQ